MKRTSVCLTVVSALLASGLLAQTRSSFDVASVKRQSAAPASFAEARVIRGQGRFRMNKPLKGFIVDSYNLDPAQIIGGPAWAESDVFTIDARTRQDATADDMKAMMRSLLEDRFHLKAHHEQRPLAHFDLVLARSDGKLGPGVVPGGTCTPEDRPKVAMPPEAEQARKQFFCGTTAAVVELMSTALEALVVDRTGLTGRFSFNIYSSPEAVGRLRPATPVSSVDPSLPSLPAAVREQLGFNVESTKSPVDVLVIDSVDPPTEN
jgi:uncharacterized protein (TIGR03435 family)